MKAIRQRIIGKDGHALLPKHSREMTTFLDRLFLPPQPGMSTKNARAHKNRTRRKGAKTSTETAARFQGAKMWC